MGASKLAVDFTNVKDGGTFSKKHMPSGDYLAKVTKVEDAKPKDPEDKSDMWLFTIQLKNTPSATYPYYCKLVDNQLWKVRNLLVAAGINVPKKKVAVDPNKIVGKLVAVSLDDTEYNGKMQSEIGSVFSPSELEGSEVDDDEDVADVDEDEDEEVAPPKKTKKAAAPEPEEDDDEDEDEGDELEGLDRSALKAYIAKNSLGVPVKKSMSDDDIRAAIRALAGDDEEEDDEEEEAPAPAPKAKKKAKAPVDEDDDEIDVEDL